ncbi:hypothetical protein DPMN_088380 [Dreissena polymorpha]|uniref:DUF4209 domain-containing protein n=1 Tax=Dreissena polymorpha TaxID=45954 RepID=A0A9D4KW34_DREPO|nr:hypothetical protein DPMN_088380 [Dreissena polymorpha]
MPFDALKLFEFQRYKTVRTEQLLKALPTCLSPYVHQLITEDTCCEDADKSVLDEHGLIDFAYINSKLKDCCVEPIDQSINLRGSICSLAPLICGVEKHFKTVSWNSFQEKYGKLMKWTGQEQTLQQVWLDVFEGDDEERPVDELTALLVTCAILERGLGDVYVFTAKSQSPSMLKDILSSKALEEFLGSDVMKVLQLFLGPPSSLNLRNVAWHGFPYPGEIPFRCILFLLVVIPSVGHILQRKLGEGQITHREPVMFPHTRHISELKVLQDGDEICQIWDTRLVSWDTHLFWNKVQKLFGKQRHSECCALLLYYLEQGCD